MKKSNSVIRLTSFSKFCHSSLVTFFSGKFLRHHNFNTYSLSCPSLVETIQSSSQTKTYSDIYSKRISILFSKCVI